MDAFLGRTNFTSFLGIESIHLRAWMPLNIRAFLAAIEVQYRVCDYVKESKNPKLIGIFDGIVESYAGERGFMGTHRCKSSLHLSSFISCSRNINSQTRYMAF